MADQVLPFSVGGGAVRGRIARLAASLDPFIDRRHDYPPVVAAMLAETAALAVVLSAALKYDGIFSLQAQGKGPISLLVVDVTSAGRLRAHARFDAARLAGIEAEAHGSVPRLLGEGYLAFTVDQGPDTERYQGIVELAGDSLAQCATTYFRQSEQLDAAFQVAAGPRPDGGGWMATAVMIQRMPAGSANAPILVAEDADEGWRRTEILLASIKDSELLDAGLGLDRLLYRLYHAEQLQVFAGRPLEGRCRCSADRVRATLASLPAGELASLADDHGRIVVSCEFCRAEHAIPLAEVERPATA